MPKTTLTVCQVSPKSGLLLIPPPELVAYKTPEAFGSVAIPITPPTPASVASVGVSVQVTPESVLRRTLPSALIYRRLVATGSMAT